MGDDSTDMTGSPSVYLQLDAVASPAGRLPENHLHRTVQGGIRPDRWMLPAHVQAASSSAAERDREQGPCQRRTHSVRLNMPTHLHSSVWLEAQSSVHLGCAPSPEHPHSVPLICAGHRAEILHIVDVRLARVRNRINLKRLGPGAIHRGQLPRPAAAWAAAAKALIFDRAVEVGAHPLTSQAAQGAKTIPVLCPMSHPPSRPNLAMTGVPPLR